MAKISEIIYDVKEGIKQYTDDSEVDDRHILYLYNIKRAKYLRREMNNYQKTVDNSALQTFCIPLELVNANECDVDFDCQKILRSTKKLPKPLDLHTKVAITKVKPTNVLGIPFNFISKDRVPFASESPFSKAMYSFLDPSGYLYVYSKSDSRLLDCLTITGVFEDPLELQNFYNCCNCDEAIVCFDEDTTDYPLQPHLIDLIREEIIRDTLRKESIEEDTENDSTS